MTAINCQPEFETEKTETKKGVIYRGKGRPRKKLDIKLYKKLKNLPEMSNIRMAKLQGMCVSALIKCLKEAGLYEYPADNRIPPLAKEQIAKKRRHITITNRKKHQNKALKTTLIPPSYKIIWDYKLLCLIHNECGQRIKVRLFEKGYRTSSIEYQEDVLMAIEEHEYLKTEKKELK